jgi:hypothetical protein
VTIVRSTFAASLLLILSACSQPVRRDTPTQAKRVSRAADAPELAKVEGPKKRIWILDFTQKTPSPPELSEVDVSAVLKQALIETMREEEDSAFLPVVADDTTLRELGITSETSVPDAARIARGSGVAGFLRADIVELGVRETLDKEGLIQARQIVLSVGLNFGLVDASTGREVARGLRRRELSETRSDFLGLQSRLGESQKKLALAGKGLGLWLLRDLNLQAHKVGWAGRVLKVEGSRIYLNAGRSSGINVGDVFKVVEEPRDVFDPQTEKFIGQAPGRVKGTSKVVEYFGLDGSVGLLQSGGGVLPGDRVELF